MTKALRPRFCADVMLGSLAKWLRILGFDVFYSNSIDDENLLRISRAEGRTLLTRDTGLAKRAKAAAGLVFVEGDHLQEQLASVNAKVPLRCDPALYFSRCPVCNALLIDAPREEMEGRVPTFVFNTTKAFKVCPGCDRVYWRGSHLVKAMQRLQNVLDQAQIPASKRRSAPSCRKQNGSSAAKSP